MAPADIPKPVRQFISRHIDSIQQVEILALLRRDGERAWTTEQVSRTLHIAHALCAEWLDRYATAGLVKRDEIGYRHQPGGSQTAVLDELVDLYARRRTTVIDAIYNKPSGSIQSFSDAFRLRKDL
jgi:hypothetical protein